MDGDGQLTDGDASVLIDAIEGGQAGVADLDRSGAADLVDLQMLAASLEETGDGTASVLVRVPESLMALEKEESTQVVKRQSGGSAHRRQRRGAEARRRCRYLGGKPRHGQL